MTREVRRKRSLERKRRRRRRVVRRERKRRRKKISLPTGTLQLFNVQTPNTHT